MKFNLLQAVKVGLDMGMTTFEVYHYLCRRIAKRIPAEEILQWIEGYEDCIPMNINYGAQGSYEGDRKYYYQHQQLCVISYRLDDEELPATPELAVAEF